MTALPPRELSSDQLSSIEIRARELGHELLQALRDDLPWFYEPRWWDERMMELAMTDEDVKVQLFRFVDVLPTLRSPAAITAHLQEYLGPVEDQLPRVMRTALSAAPAGTIRGDLLARATRVGVMRQARRFIAGSNVGQVVAAALREREAGRAFTLDILGEAVTNDIEATHYFDSYLTLIREVTPRVNEWSPIDLLDRDGRGAIPRANISIKLSALDSHFDPIDPEGTFTRVASRLRTLLRAAREVGAFINIDMESYHTKDLTLSIVQQVLSEEEFRSVRDVGVVIQCYLRDSLRDLERLYKWADERDAPIWVRLVKGAYWDYETIHAQSERWPIPVYQQKWHTDANFERAARFVLARQHVLRPAIASHNVRSLAYSMAVADEIDVPREDLEIQMLYGMAEAEKRALVERGYRVRVYMPYGELIPGMAYLVRRLLENTSNDSFLRAAKSEAIDADALLQNPIPAGNERELDAATQGKPPSVASPVPTDAAGETLPMSQQNDTSAPYWQTFVNEPLSDFSLEVNRRAMSAALGHVSDQLGAHVPLVVGGESLSTSDTLRSENPSDTAQTVGTSASATAAEARLAIVAARAALPAWAACGIAERALVLRRAADIMRDRRFELAAWIVYEAGKGWREADADVAEAIDFLEFYAAGGEHLHRPQGVRVPGEQNRFVYIPRGVAAVIAPWNFPLAILTGMTAAALATGNTVIMKPAEQTPIVAARLMEILQQAGIPPGAVNFLPGPGETAGSELVEHPDVDLIAFTGSRQVGLMIHATAARLATEGQRGVKKVIAEMGGKNAIVVDADADLDEAVIGVVRSAFAFQGQKCSACSRAIVLADAYDTFTRRLIDAARSLPIGAATDPANRMGPVIDAEAALKIGRYIEIGRREGTELLAVETKDLAAQGHFVGPHIFGDVPPEGRLAQEEVFGPVLAVIRAADLDEAFAIAGNTDYALTGGFYSRSPASLERACREMVVGNLYLNRGCTGALVGRQPFGGFKMSGIGSKAGGHDYLLQYVLPRTITENTMRRGFAPDIE